MALDAGVRTLYHCSWADAQSIERMAADKDKLFYGPAIGVIVATLQASPPPHIDMSAMKDSAAEVLALDKALVPALKARGVRIVIGGDYGFPFNPNGTNARDLDHFVQHFGFTPAEALVAATRTGGELMGLDVGQVREGFLADLLLVRGDPTVDVRVLLDRANLAMVMKGGQVHAPAARVGVPA
jgi:imidazolonepropionase-like amidohydrolase